MLSTRTEINGVLTKLRQKPTIKKISQVGLSEEVPIKMLL